MLNKMELRILRVLDLYSSIYIGTQELHGYFRFCDLDKIREAVYNLKGQELIDEYQKPAYGYYITTAGKHHLLKLKKEDLNKFWKIVVTLIGLALTALGVWSQWPK
ncbi:hypothetical protein [Hydrogenoanaerobacterium sp.]|uniref:hypothetical protein n=1 Tax=Hydrogenoanaerobacterium sp. TaxID=2953763 RepID=UPI00289F1F72|nr:hypothetical protein [Hydrogenoanaerobacterium sp.]